MKASGESTDNQAASSHPLPLEDEKKQQILHELDNILESRFFRSAGRCKQFLRYVVQHKLNGPSEPLKERTIGVEVFERRHDYATGDDPVVRVQAGEVRRRLEQYYQGPPTEPLVHIELPVGSYSPVFREPRTVAPSHTAPFLPPSPEPGGHLRKYRGMYWAIAAVCLALAISTGIAFLAFRHPAGQKSALDEFWKPVFATPQAVMICLPAAVDYGVGRGDAHAAVALSALLGKIGKPSQVRMGTNYSFEDLRNSPAVMVGAFNNKWTMQITSSLRFAFVLQDGRYLIREQTDGSRVWVEHRGNTGEVIDDTAVVARLLDSKTGQFTVIVAGIGERGTQAAGEFVSNPELLEQGLRSAPAGWRSKNLEFVLQTTVTDSVPGPPRVVAAYSW